VDAFLHPLVKLDPSFLIIDALLHGIVEQNPPESLAKFIKYNLPRLLDKLAQRETN
jgi:hypothetical protein